MTTALGSPSTTLTDANGTALASVLAAGIGTFGMGLFVILNEGGAFAAPNLYGPAGGVTGRTTFATIVWLAAWGVLHARWSGREVAPTRIFAWTLALIGAGILGTFPPVWALLP